MTEEEFLSQPRKKPYYCWLGSNFKQSGCTNRARFLTFMENYDWYCQECHDTGKVQEYLDYEESLKYDYFLVDGGWLLTRAFLAIRGKAENRFLNDEYKQVAVSFIYSAIKTAKSWNCKKIIFLHDSSPYHKNSIVGDYKGDRIYATQEDLENASGAEYDAIETELINADHKYKAKYILQNLSMLGLPSLQYPGYEADDLAYICALEISKRGEKALLFSIDGDWKFWVTPGVDWLQFRKDELGGPVLHKHDEIREDMCIPEELSVFEYTKYYQSFYGSHNHLHNTVDDKDWNQPFLNFFTAFNELEDNSILFKDKELFDKQFLTFEMDKYPEYDLVLDKVSKIHELHNNLTNNFQSAFRSLDLSMYPQGWEKYFNSL